MTYHFDFRDGYVLVVVRGQLTLDEEIEAFRALVASPSFRPGMSMILDNRERPPGADAAHMRGMFDEIADTLALSSIPRLAFVASRTRSFALGALFETLAAQRGVALEVHVFAGLENAIEWVCGHRAEGTSARSTEDDAQRGGGRA